MLNLKQSNYSNHLRFEDRPNSKEFQLDKCIKVLGMIARLKDRNQIIEDCCENFYGKSENGRIKAPETEAIKYSTNIATIKRLKSYYNYCLSNLKQFQST